MDDETLIAAVEKHQALYDKTNNKYSNRMFIQKQWTEVGLEVGEEAENVRKRWARLRDYFQRCHKNVKSFKSGPAGGKGRKWYLYDAMSFLIPYLADRPSTSNIMSQENEVSDLIESLSIPTSPPLTEPEIDFTQDSQRKQFDEEGRQQPGQQQQEQQQQQQPQHKMDSIVSTTPCRKRKSPQERTSNASLFDMVMLKTMKDLGEGVTRIMKPERVQDDDEMYCLSLVPKMKELDSILKLECQAELNTVLVKYLKLKAMKTNRHEFSTTPVRTPDSFDSTIHQAPSHVGPSTSI